MKPISNGLLGTNMQCGASCSTASISDAWLPAGTLSQVELKPSTECTQDLYWPHDPSLVTTSTPNFEGMNTLFEACSQTVALEGDHWDLSTVSTMRHQ
jgi:hypothetical protein